VFRFKGSGFRNLGYQSFEDLQVWKRSSALCVKLYELFKASNEYWIKDQLLRSSLSVPSNIAEGYDRDSSGDTIRFLNIAKASLSELRTQIYIALKLKFITNEQGNKIIKETKELSSMLYSLINSKKQNNAK
jgi:four helix bundle protein